VSVSVSMSVSVLVDFAGRRWFESCTEPLARCVLMGTNSELDLRVCDESYRRSVGKATSS